MKLLTFLGATDAYETTYCMPDGREYTAPFCGVALAHVHPECDMRVFVTEKARKMHYARFEELVEGKVANLEDVSIADGRDDAELWEVFRAVVDAVEPNEQVIFDITHGFRSLPFLSFLAAAYLRVVKKIDLTAVLYGNFEARDQSVQPHRAPVVDLTAFVSLLDWMTAADRFTRFGDARDLAGLLRNHQTPLLKRRAADGDEEARSVLRSLRATAAAIEQIAIPLRVAQPLETMEAAAALDSVLVSANSDFVAWVQPFALVSEEVRTAYAPFGFVSPLAVEAMTESLLVQRAMIDWYKEKQQIMQAMTLAREWMISWAMNWLGLTPINARELREQVGGMFASEAHRYMVEREAQEERSLADPFVTTMLQAIPQVSDALVLYHQIGEVRNDMDHAGMREGSIPARKLLERADSLCGRLASLPLPPCIQKDDDD